MLGTALADPDPVVIFEHVQLYNTTTDLDGLIPTDISRAAIRRRGSDVTVITYGGCLPKALDAANELSLAGIDCEVIDLRVLRPLDTDTILQSVRKTHRAVSSTRPGAQAAWPPRSALASWRARSSTSTRRSPVSAAPKCRCRMPSTLNRRRCRSRTRSSPP